MFKGGTMLRLIDVVLNILFGFLGITDFEMKSQIKLPSTIGVSQQEIRQQVIFVKIKDDHLFEVMDDRSIVKEFQEMQALEDYIVQLSNAYFQNSLQMILVIEPNVETKIQTTVDVMDICEKHHIPKNLSYSHVELN